MGDSKDNVEERTSDSLGVDRNSYADVAFGRNSPCPGQRGGSERSDLVGGEGGESCLAQSFVLLTSYPGQVGASGKKLTGFSARPVSSSGGGFGETVAQPGGPVPDFELAAQEVQQTKVHAEKVFKNRRQNKPSGQRKKEFPSREVRGAGAAAAEVGGGAKLPELVYDDIWRKEEEQDTRRVWKPSESRVRATSAISCNVVQVKPDAEASAVALVEPVGRASDEGKSYAAVFFGNCPLAEVLVPTATRRDSSENGKRRSHGAGERRRRGGGGAVGERPPGGRRGRFGGAGQGRNKEEGSRKLVKDPNEEGISNIVQERLLGKEGEDVNIERSDDGTVFHHPTIPGLVIGGNGNINDIDASPTRKRRHRGGHKKRSKSEPSFQDAQDGQQFVIPEVRRPTFNARDSEDTPPLNKEGKAEDGRNGGRKERGRSTKVKKVEQEIAKERPSQEPTVAGGTVEEAPANRVEPEALEEQVAEAKEEPKKKRKRKLKKKQEQDHEVEDALLEVESLLSKGKGFGVTIGDEFLECDTATAVMSTATDETDIKTSEKKSKKKRSKNVKKVVEEGICCDAEEVMTTGNVPVSCSTLATAKENVVTSNVRGDDASISSLEEEKKVQVAPNSSQVIESNEERLSSSPLIEAPPAESVKEPQVVGGEPSSIHVGGIDDESSQDAGARDIEIGATAPLSSKDALVLPPLLAAECAMLAAETTEAVVDSEETVQEVELLATTNEDQIAVELVPTTQVSTDLEGELRCRCQEVPSVFESVAPLDDRAVEGPIRVGESDIISEDLVLEQVNEFAEDVAMDESPMEAADSRAMDDEDDDDIVMGSPIGFEAEEQEVEEEDEIVMGSPLGFGEEDDDDIVMGSPIGFEHDDFLGEGSEVSKTAEVEPSEEGCFGDGKPDELGAVEVSFETENPEMEKPVKNLDSTPQESEVQNEGVKSEKNGKDIKASEQGQREVNCGFMTVDAKTDINPEYTVVQKPLAILHDELVLSSKIPDLQQDCVGRKDEEHNVPAIASYASVVKAALVEHEEEQEQVSGIISKDANNQSAEAMVPLPEGKHLEFDVNTGSVQETPVQFTPAQLSLQEQRREDDELLESEITGLRSRADRNKGVRRKGKKSSKEEDIRESKTPEIPDQVQTTEPAQPESIIEFKTVTKRSKKKGGFNAWQEVENAAIEIPSSEEPQSEVRSEETQEIAAITVAPEPVETHSAFEAPDVVLMALAGAESMETSSRPGNKTGGETVTPDPTKVSPFEAKTDVVPGGDEAVVNTVESAQVANKDLILSPNAQPAVMESTNRISKKSKRAKNKQANLEDNDGQTAQDKSDGPTEICVSGEDRALAEPGRNVVMEPAKTNQDFIKPEADESQSGKKKSKNKKRKTQDSEGAAKGEIDSSPPADTPMVEGPIISDGGKVTKEAMDNSDKVVLVGNDAVSGSTGAINNQVKAESVGEEFVGNSKRIDLGVGGSHGVQVNGYNKPLAEEEEAVKVVPEARLKKENVLVSEEDLAGKNNDALGSARLEEEEEEVVKPGGRVLRDEKQNESHQLSDNFEYIHQVLSQENIENTFQQIYELERAISPPRAGATCSDAKEVSGREGLEKDLRDLADGEESSPIPQVAQEVHQVSTGAAGVQVTGTSEVAAETTTSVNLEGSSRKGFEEFPVRPIRESVDFTISVVALAEAESLWEEHLAKRSGTVDTGDRETVWEERGLDSIKANLERAGNGTENELEASLTKTRQQTPGFSYADALRKGLSESADIDAGGLRQEEDDIEQRGKNTESHVLEASLALAAELENNTPVRMLALKEAEENYEEYLESRKAPPASLKKSEPVAIPSSPIPESALSEFDLREEKGTTIPDLAASVADAAAEMLNVAIEVPRLRTVGDSSEEDLFSLEDVDYVEPSYEPLDEETSISSLSTTSHSQGRKASDVPEVVPAGSQVNDKEKKSRVEVGVDALSALEEPAAAAQKKKSVTFAEQVFIRKFGGSVEDDFVVGPVSGNDPWTPLYVSLSTLDASQVPPPLNEELLRSTVGDGVEEVTATSSDFSVSPAHVDGVTNSGSLTEEDGIEVLATTENQESKTAIDVTVNDEPAASHEPLTTMAGASSDVITVDIKKDKKKKTDLASGTRTSGESCQDEYAFLQEEGSVISFSFPFLFVCQEAERQYFEYEETLRRRAAANVVDVGGDVGGNGHDDSDDDNNDDKGRKRGGGGGGSSEGGDGVSSAGGGGSQGGPVTEMLNSDLQNQNWVDWSTQLKLGPVLDSGCPVMKSENQEQEGKAEEQESRKTRQIDELKARQDFIGLEIGNLTKAIDQAVDRLLHVKLEDAEETLQITQDLASRLKTLRETGVAVRSTLETLPPGDPEVFKLRQNLEELAKRIDILQKQTDKLHVGTKRMFEKRSGETARFEKMADGSDGTLSLVEDDGGRGSGGLPNATFRALEISTVVIPSENVAENESTDESGHKFVTRVSRTVTLSQKKEVTMSHSYENGEGVRSPVPSVSSCSSPIPPSSTSSTTTTTEQVPIERVLSSPSLDVNSDGGEMTVSLPIKALNQSELSSQLQQIISGGEEEDVTVRVRQVTQHVTRRIIRKRRKIIRKIVIVNGVEQVHEEIVDEPDEVDEQTSEICSGPTYDIQRGNKRRDEATDESRQGASSETVGPYQQDGADNTVISTVLSDTNNSQLEQAYALLENVPKTDASTLLLESSTAPMGVVESADEHAKDAQQSQVDSVDKTELPSKEQGGTSEQAAESQESKTITNEYSMSTKIFKPVDEPVLSPDTPKEDVEKVEDKAKVLEGRDLGNTEVPPEVSAQIPLVDEFILPVVAPQEEPKLQEVADLAAEAEPSVGNGEVGLLLTSETMPVAKLQVDVEEGALDSVEEGTLGDLTKAGLIHSVDDLTRIGDDASVTQVEAEKAEDWMETQSLAAGPEEELRLTPRTVHSNPELLKQASEAEAEVGDELERVQKPASEQDVPLNTDAASGDGWQEDQWEMPEVPSVVGGEILEEKASICKPEFQLGSTEAEINDDMTDSLYELISQDETGKQAAEVPENLTTTPAHHEEALTESSALFLEPVSSGYDIKTEVSNEVENIIHEIETHSVGESGIEMATANVEQQVQNAVDTLLIEETEQPQERPGSWGAENHEAISSREAEIEISGPIDSEASEKWQLEVSQEILEKERAPEVSAETEATRIDSIPSDKVSAVSIEEYRTEPTVLQDGATSDKPMEIPPVLIVDETKSEDPTTPARPKRKGKHHQEGIEPAEEVHSASVQEPTDAPTDVSPPVLEESRKAEDEGPKVVEEVKATMVYVPKRKKNRKKKGSKDQSPELTTSSQDEKSIDSTSLNVDGKGLVPEIPVEESSSEHTLLAEKMQEIGQRESSVPAYDTRILDECVQRLEDSSRHETMSEDAALHSVKQKKKKGKKGRKSLPPRESSQDSEQDLKPQESDNSKKDVTPEPIVAPKRSKKKKQKAQKHEREEELSEDHASTPEPSDTREAPASMSETEVNDKELSPAEPVAMSLKDAAATKEVAELTESPEITKPASIDQTSPAKRKRKRGKKQSSLDQIPCDETDFKEEEKLSSSAASESQNIPEKGDSLDTRRTTDVETTPDVVRKPDVEADGVKHESVTIQASLDAPASVENPYELSADADIQPHQIVMDIRSKEDESLEENFAKIPEGTQDSTSPRIDVVQQKRETAEEDAKTEVLADLVKISASIEAPESLQQVGEYGADADIFPHHITMEVVTQDQESQQEPSLQRQALEFGTFEDQRVTEAEILNDRLFQSASSEIEPVGMVDTKQEIQKQIDISPLIFDSVVHTIFNPVDDQELASQLAKLETNVAVVSAATDDTAAAETSKSGILPNSVVDDTTNEVLVSHPSSDEAISTGKEAERNTEDTSASPLTTDSVVYKIMSHVDEDVIAPQLYSEITKKSVEQKAHIPEEIAGIEVSSEDAEKIKTPTESEISELKAVNDGSDIELGEEPFDLHITKLATDHRSSRRAAAPTSDEVRIIEVDESRPHSAVEIFEALGVAADRSEDPKPTAIDDSVLSEYDIVDTDEVPQDRGPEEGGATSAADEPLHQRNESHSVDFEGHSSAEKELEQDKKRLKSTPPSETMTTGEGQNKDSLARDFIIPAKTERDPEEIQSGDVTQVSEIVPEISSDILPEQRNPGDDMHQLRERRHSQDEAAKGSFRETLTQATEGLSATGKADGKPAEELESQVSIDRNIPADFYAQEDETSYRDALLVGVQPIPRTILDVEPKENVDQEMRSQENLIQEDKLGESTSVTQPGVYDITTTTPKAAKTYKPGETTVAASKSGDAREMIPMKPGIHEVKIEDVPETVFEPVQQESGTNKHMPFKPSVVEETLEYQKSPEVAEAQTVDLEKPITPEPVAGDVRVTASGESVPSMAREVLSTEELKPTGITETATKLEEQPVVSATEPNELAVVEPVRDSEAVELGSTKGSEALESGLAEVASVKSMPAEKSSEQAHLTSAVDITSTHDVSRLSSIQLQEDEDFSVYAEPTELERRDERQTQLEVPQTSDVLVLQDFVEELLPEVPELCVESNDLPEDDQASELQEPQTESSIIAASDDLIPQMANEEMEHHIRSHEPIPVETFLSQEILALQQSEIADQSQHCAKTDDIGNQTPTAQSVESTADPKSFTEVLKSSKPQVLVPDDDAEAFTTDKSNKAEVLQDVADGSNIEHQPTKPNQLISLSPLAAEDSLVASDQKEPEKIEVELEAALKPEEEPVVTEKDLIDPHGSKEMSNSRIPEETQEELNNLDVVSEVPVTPSEVFNGGNLVQLANVRQERCQPTVTQLPPGDVSEDQLLAAALDVASLDSRGPSPAPPHIDPDFSRSLQSSPVHDDVIGMCVGLITAGTPSPEPVDKIEHRITDDYLQRAERRTLEGILEHDHAEEEEDEYDNSHSAISKNDQQTLKKIRGVTFAVEPDVLGETDEDSSEDESMLQIRPYMNADAVRQKLKAIEQGLIEPSRFGASTPGAGLLIFSRLDEMLMQIDKKLYELEESQKDSSEAIVTEEIIEILEVITEYINQIQQETVEMQVSGMPQSYKKDIEATLSQNLGDLDERLSTLDTILHHVNLSEEVQFTFQKALRSTERACKGAKQKLDTDLLFIADVDSLKTELGQKIQTAKADLMVLMGKIDEVRKADHKSGDQDLALKEIEKELRGLQQNTQETLSKSYDFMNDYPEFEEYMLDDLNDLGCSLAKVEDELEKEITRKAQAASLADEYQQTLEEFANVIKVAEGLVDSRVHVTDLEGLQNEIQKFREFFKNFKKCQATLEKLVIELETETSNAHKDLHETLFRQGAELQDRAAHKRQQMAVSASRWSRLEQGLDDENNWLSALEKKMPPLENLTSEDAQKLKTVYQSLYTDVIIHQSRLMQLKTVCDSLSSELIDCPALNRKVESIVDRHLAASNLVTQRLQRLISFRDLFGNYENLKQRLYAWLHRSEGKMDVMLSSEQSYPYDFWELKAQLESQQPIKEECKLLLNQALESLQVLDGDTLLEDFEAFENRWNILQSAVVTQGDHLEYSEEVMESPNIEQIAKELDVIRKSFKNLKATIQNEDDLYNYLEELQVLKAQVMNKQHQLTAALNNAGISPSDAEKIGFLNGILVELRTELTEELEVIHTVRERFGTFSRMQERAKRVQDNLKVKVDQWSSFFDLSQDLLRQALQNCQVFTDEIVTNNQDLEKMRHVISTIPTTEHIALDTSKMQQEVLNMESNMHTLSARVQDLGKRVQDQLGYWNEYEQLYNTVSQRLNENLATIQVLSSEFPANEQTIRFLQRGLKNLRTFVNNTSDLTKLKSFGEKLKEEGSEDIKKQTDNQLDSLVDGFKRLSDSVSELESQCDKILELYQRLSQVNQKVGGWLEGKLHLTGSEWISRETWEVIQNEVGTCEHDISEGNRIVEEILSVQQSIMATDSRREDINLVVVFDGLSKNLAGLKLNLGALNILFNNVALADVSNEQNAIAKDLQDLQNSAILQDSGPAQLHLVQDKLIHLSKAGGKAKELSTRLPCSDAQVKNVLQTSRELLHDTFRDYAKIWKYLSANEDDEEVLEVMRKYLADVDQFLREPCGSTREQMSMDLSLIGLYKDVMREHKRSLNVSEGQNAEMERLLAQYEALQEGLDAREREISEKMSKWQAYLEAQQNFVRWLKALELEKKKLDLPFLNLGRTRSTKDRVEALVEQSKDGETLLQRCKDQKGALEFANPEVLSSIQQDIALNATRYDNIKAALQTWRDHITRILEIQQTFQEKLAGVYTLLDEITEVYEQTSTPQLLTELPAHSKSLQGMIERTQNVTPYIDELQNTVDEMKNSISPSDCRALNQKMWGISQRQTELLAVMRQSLSNVQDKIALLPMFEDKCRSLLQWTTDFASRIDSSPCENLDDYQHLLYTDLTEDLHVKANLYSEMDSLSSELLRATKGKEHKEISKLKKKVTVEWDKVMELFNDRKSRVPELVQIIQQLSGRSKNCLSRLRKLQKSTQIPIECNQFSSETIQGMLKSLDADHRRVNNESSELNQILHAAEIAATDCDNMRLTEDSAKVRALIKQLQDSWKITIDSFNARRNAVAGFKTSWNSLMDDADSYESILSQALDELSCQQISEETDMTKLLTEFEGIESSLRSLSPRIQDLENSYCLLMRSVSCATTNKLGDKVKNVLDNWKRANADYLCKKSAIVGSCSKNIDDLTESVRNSVKKLKSLKKKKDLEKISRILEEVNESIEALNPQEDGIREVLHHSVLEDIETLGDARQKLDVYSNEKQLVLELYEKLSLEQEQLKVQKEQPVDSAVQVKTWPEEVERAVQVDTLQQLSSHQQPREDRELNKIPEIIETKIDSGAPLTRTDIYELELRNAISDTRTAVLSLSEVLTPSSEAQNPRRLQDAVVKELGSAQAAVDLLRHLRRLISEDKDQKQLTSTEEKEIQGLVDDFERLEPQARSVSQKLRDQSPTKSKVSCPICSPAKRETWDSLLWRLEQWLVHAEGTLQKAMKNRPPHTLEELEDCILAHRELLLDLDSHRSLVEALRVISEHLEEHEAPPEGLEDMKQLKKRLKKTLKWWSKVCHNAAAWQARLQMALLENSDFHQTVTDYEEFVSRAQQKVQELEPVDLSDEPESIAIKLKEFKRLRGSVSRKQPELETLKHTAKQLFINPKTIEQGIVSDSAEKVDTENIFVTPECEQVMKRINDALQDLIFVNRVCEAYVKYLSTFSGDFTEIDRDETASPYLLFSEEILDGRISPARSTTPLPAAAYDNDEDNSTLSAVIRGGRQIGRVVRTSSPIVALLILLLGAASLIPYSEQDYSCSTANTFARSLEPMLHHEPGPPTI